MQCDGHRPICSTCRAKRSECTYKERDRPRSVDTSTKILNLLRSVGQDEAIELLQRLRASSEPDTESLLSQPQSQGQTGGRSDRNAYRGRTPESPYIAEQYLALRATGIELELLARYPISYPSLCPIDADTFPLEALPDSLSRPGSPGETETQSGSTDVRYAKQAKRFQRNPYLSGTVQLTCEFCQHP